MRPSLHVLNARKPLINFVGRRSWPSSICLFYTPYSLSPYSFLVVEPEAQRPHPAAPSELQRSFSDFLKKFEVSATLPDKKSQGANGSKQAFAEFWEAPARFWKPRMRDLEDAEIDAVLVRACVAL